MFASYLFKQRMLMQMWSH